MQIRMSAEYILHDLDVGGVKFIDSPFGWDAHSADEECRLVFYDNVNELRKLTAGVVILQAMVEHRRPANRYQTLALVFLALPPTWGSSKSTPNGAFLSSRWDLRSSMEPWRNLGLWRTPPMTPMPPVRWGWVPARPIKYCATNLR